MIFRPVTCSHAHDKFVKNYNDLQVFLDCLHHDFSIIGISESWFKPTTDAHLFNLPGYSLVNICRSDSIGGGVAFYINDSIEYKLRCDLSGSKPGYESIFIEVVDSKNKHILIGCVYRAPGYEVKSFYENFDQYMHALCGENKDVYIMGDFNVNLLNSDTYENVMGFLDFMYSYNMFPLITKPTRITDTSATLIDNIFVNCIQNDIECGLIFSDLSDHLPVFCIDKGKKIEFNSEQSC